MGADSTTTTTTTTCSCCATASATSAGRLGISKIGCITASWTVAAQSAVDSSACWPTSCCIPVGSGLCTGDPRSNASSGVGSTIDYSGYVASATTSRDDSTASGDREGKRSSTIGDFCTGLAVEPRDRG